MRTNTLACAYLTITTFLGFFLIEALLWTIPIVSRILVPQLNPDLAIAIPEQAEILRALFVNQGVYNLMAAAAGIIGVVAIRRRRDHIGRAFVGYTFVFGLVAALTLFASTHAYLLGVFQAASPLLGLVLLRREQRTQ